MDGRYLNYWTSLRRYNKCYIQEMIPHDDDTRSAQQSEQGHNKEQGAASTEQPVHAAEVTAQSSGNETDHSKSSQNEGIF